MAEIPDGVLVRLAQRRASGREWAIVAAVARLDNGAGVRQMEIVKATGIGREDVSRLLSRPDGGMGSAETAGGVVGLVPEGLLTPNGTGPKPAYHVGEITNVDVGESANTNGGSVGESANVGENTNVNVGEITKAAAGDVGESTNTATMQPPSPAPSNTPPSPTPDSGRKSNPPPPPMPPASSGGGSGVAELVFEEPDDSPNRRRCHELFEKLAGKSDCVASREGLNDMIEQYGGERLLGALERAKLKDIQGSGLIMWLWTFLRGGGDQKGAGYGGRSDGKRGRSSLGL